MKSRQLLIIFLLCFALFLPKEKLHSETTPQDSQGKFNYLLVYGENFFFKVEEPDNWIGDTKNAAKYSSNIIFYPKKNLDEDSPFIYIILFDREGYSIDEHLKADMEKFKSKYPLADFSDCKMVHKSYESTSKIYKVENLFTDYVTYVNPGQKFFSFSMVMNVPKRKATPEELEVFREILNSIEFMDIKVKKDSDSQ